jgi:hypothetical protein
MKIPCGLCKFFRVALPARASFIFKRRDIHHLPLSQALPASKAFPFRVTIRRVC